jgi:hypothetical protein
MRSGVIKTGEEEAERREDEGERRKGREEREGAG